MKRTGQLPIPGVDKAADKIVGKCLDETDGAPLVDADTGEIVGVRYGTDDGDVVELRAGPARGDDEDA